MSAQCGLTAQRAAGAPLGFFELAVATAIALFGIESGAALASVVWVLIEVPLMLMVVKAVNRSRDWYERGVARV